jgi:alkylation response protein AidB-like acyl-CoA dehydrogenase
VLTDAIDDAEPAEVREYRHRLRSFLNPWRSRAPEWEDEGRLPARVFADAGAAGILRQRWQHDRAAGVHHALALADETAKVSPSLSLGLCIHAEVFCGALLTPRTPYLAAVRETALAGGAIGCVASTEWSGGSSIGAPSLRAERVADAWHLRGEKRFISDGSLATHAVVSATAVDTRRSGHTLFLVALDAPGVRRQGGYGTLGMRGCDTSLLSFDVDVDDEARLCRVGSGGLHISRVLQMERLLGSRQVLTSARQALAYGVAFLRSRAIDGVRLIDRQALRHRLADCAVDLLAAEALVAHVAARVAAGAPAAREIAAVKLKATSTACRITDEALQFFGGRGYTINYPLERLWRDVRVGRIGGGSDEIMREIIGNGLDREEPGVAAELGEIERRDAPSLRWDTC